MGRAGKTLKMRIENLTILGLSAESSLADARKAHKKLVWAHHPDRISQSGLSPCFATKRCQAFNRAIAELTNLHFFRGPRSDFAKIDFAKAPVDEKDLSRYRSSESISQRTRKRLETVMVDEAFIRGIRMQLKKKRRLGKYNAVLKRVRRRISAVKVLLRMAR